MLTRRALLGTGAALALASGCARQLPAVNTAAAGFGSGATGTVEVWCRSATQTGIQFMADTFHQQQDRVRVRVTPVPDAQFVTKLATAIRGGRVPDLVDFDDINSMLFIFRGAFADLTDLIDRLPGKEKLSPGHLALATKDDRVYAVPFLADNSVLFCNTELFEQAGLDIDDSTKDFASILEAARKLSGLGDDVHGWSIPGNAAGSLGFTVQPHIWATETDLITGEVGDQRGNVAGNDALRRTLEFQRTLWQEKLVPSSAYAEDGSTYPADFLAGRVGMTPRSFGGIVKNADDELLSKITVRLLCGPDGGRAFFDGGNNLCLVNGARNPSAAWEFAAFCVAPEQQARLPEGNYTPIRSDVATPEFREKYPLAVPTLDQLDAGYAPTTLAYNLLYNQPDGPWLAMYRRAVFDGEVEAAMEEAQRSYDRILRQAQA